MSLNALKGADFLTARTFLGTSIAAVSKFTGINRNNIGSFERETLILGRSDKQTLKEFYEARGYQFEQPEAQEAASDSSTSDTKRPKPVKAPTERPIPADIRVVDGFTFPVGMTDDEIEAVIDQFMNNEQELATLLSGEMESQITAWSSFWDRNQNFRDEAAEMTFKALILMAENYLKMRSLQGTAVISSLDNKRELLAFDVEEPVTKQEVFVNLFANKDEAIKRVSLD